MEFGESWVSNPNETRGPLMSITGWSLTGVSAFFLFFRLCIRQHQRKLWLDDACITISWALMLTQVILNQLAINIGFGKHILDVNLNNFVHIEYLVQCELTVSVIAITLSKISFGLTLLRLTDGWARRFVYFAIATLAIFATPACVILWLQCQSSVSIPGRCLGKRVSVTYGQFQGIWSAIMDVSLALLPWKIIWNLQMRLAEKIGVGVAMSLGLLAGAAAVVRASYVDQLTTQDLSYDSYNSIIWSVAECSMAVVATSIPVLRVIFKQAFNSAVEGYNSSGRSKGTKSKNPSTIGSSRDRAAARQSSKKTTDTSASEETVKDVFGRPRDYIELDDIAVEEESKGGGTASITESLPDAPERHAPNWPV